MSCQSGCRPARNCVLAHATTLPKILISSVVYGSSRGSIAIDDARGMRQEVPNEARMGGNQSIADQSAGAEVFATLFAEILQFE